MRFNTANKNMIKPFFQFGKRQILNWNLSNIKVLFKQGGEEVTRQAHTSLFLKIPEYRWIETIPC